MDKPLIDIDPYSGFCHGVVSAIAKAEEELRERPGAVLYCLGDIVHNSREVERLERLGLRTITHADLPRLSRARMLLRAHGEPPATYDTAAANRIDIIDATCPVVLKLQQRIKHTHQTAGEDTQIVIYGKPGHAEVNGLVGQTAGRAIVVQNVEDLCRMVDFNRNIELYSQTTKSLDGFRSVIDEIERRRAPGITFRYYDTICRQVANRVPRLRAFARDRSVVLFVSDEKSSNGRVLLQECLSVNPRTHFVATEEDVQPDWFVDAQTIGICGATSTPRWLMERVRDRVVELTQN